MIEEETKDEETKSDQGNDDEDDDDEYGDDIDAELDNLEQSVRGDDEDMDTDEDDGQAQPDFAPYDRSLKKKAGVGSRTGSQSSGGLGAHSSIKGP